MPENNNFLTGCGLDDMIVLVDPVASCDFDRTIVRSAATGTALPADRLAELYVKLDLFVRLRRATGWSLADLDGALRAFVPGGTAGSAMFGAPVRTALVHLSRAVQTERLLGTDERARRRLVCSGPTSRRTGHYRSVPSCSSVGRSASRTPASSHCWVTCCPAPLKVPANLLSLGRTCPRCRAPWACGPTSCRPWPTATARHGTPCRWGWPRCQRSTATPSSPTPLAGR